MKARLEAEGLFREEYKLPIPRYPRRVGVITSPTGAAVRDIINVMTRRAPSVEIYLYPALVQGDGAEESLIRALDYFDSSCGVDTVIIGRGGGSIEDLWAFNGERLARRIFSMRIPVISAVGHETDFTIADFVSDLRAPTPSAAAELAVPDMREVGMRILTALDRCESALLRSVERKRERLSDISSSVVYRDPASILVPYRERVSEVKEELSSTFSRYIKERRLDFTARLGRLEALNPLAVLRRGYAVMYKDGKAITDSESVNAGDTVRISLARGEVTASVTEVNKR